jgi:hypothetical protein
MTQPLPPLHRGAPASRSARVGLALWAGVMLLTAASAVLLALSSGAEFPEQWGFRGGTMLLAVAYASVGALIVARRPENPICWIWLGAGMLSGVEGFCEQYSTYTSFVSQDGAPLAGTIAWISAWIWIPMVALTWCVLPLLFPNGRLLSPRWRPALWLAGAGVGLCSAVFALAPPGAADSGTSFRLPTGEALLNALFLCGFVALLLSSLAGAASLGVRVRRAGTIERQQIKWFAFAAALLALSIPAATIPLLESLVVLTTLGLPLATTMAILRYRLFDIDIIIRRTLVYTALTLTLGAIYLVSVVALQGLFVRLTGQASTLAVVASTLGIAALFGPLRARVQELIDRRFFRTRYDTQRVLEQFALRARDETDLDALAAGLVGTIRATMQPEHVRLWLPPPERVASEERKA